MASVINQGAWNTLDQGAWQDGEPAASTSSSSSSLQSVSSSSSQSTSVSASTSVSSSSQSISTSSSSSLQSASSSSSCSSSCSTDPDLDYSRGTFAALPSSYSNLATDYTCPDYPKVEVYNDGNFVTQSATDTKAGQMFKRKVTSNTQAIIVNNCWVRSDLSCAQETMSLRIYDYTNNNFNTTVATDTTTNSDTWFNLTGSVTSGISDHCRDIGGGEYEITLLVEQEAASASSSSSSGG